MKHSGGPEGRAHSEAHAVAAVRQELTSPTRKRQEPRFAVSQSAGAESVPVQKPGDAFTSSRGRALEGCARRLMLLLALKSRSEDADILSLQPCSLACNPGCELGLYSTGRVTHTGPLTRCEAHLHDKGSLSFMVSVYSGLY